MEKKNSPNVTRPPARGRPGRRAQAEVKPSKGAHYVLSICKKYIYKIPPSFSHQKNDGSLLQFLQCKKAMLAISQHFGATGGHGRVKSLRMVEITVVILVSRFRLLFHTKRMMDLYCNFCSAKRPCWPSPKLPTFSSECLCAPQVLPCFLWDLCRKVLLDLKANCSEGLR